MIYYISDITHKYRFLDVISEDIYVTTVSCHSIMQRINETWQYPITQHTLTQALLAPPGIYKTYFITLLQSSRPHQQHPSLPTSHLIQQQHARPVSCQCQPRAG